MTERMSTHIVLEWIMYKEPEKINITMNPDQLRELADKMERVFPTKRIGDTTFIDYLGYSRELQVCLLADQDWFNKRERDE